MLDATSFTLASAGLVSVFPMQREQSRRRLRKEPSARALQPTESLQTHSPPSFKYLKSADFIFQCRRPLFVAKNPADLLLEFSLPSQEMSEEEVAPPIDEDSISTIKAPTSIVHSELEQASRRKVSKALLGMATNSMMAPYFVNSGGIEAVFRLLSDTDDVEVLTMCAGCIFQMTTYSEFLLQLLHKHVIQNLITLIEHGNEEIRFQNSRSLANITNCPNNQHQVDDTHFLSLLISSGMLVAIQILFNKCKRTDSLSYTLLCLSNIAPGLTENSDLEMCVRLTLNAVKRLNVLHDRESAFFVSEVLKNMTRLVSYTYLLCEEGVLSVLLTLVDQYSRDLQIVASCTEAIVNVSANSKNRRKLVTSGIHQRLLSIFDLKDPNVSTNLLAMISNMLRAVIQLF